MCTKYLSTLFFIIAVIFFTESSVALTSKGIALNSEKFPNEVKEPVDQSVTAYIVTVKSKPGRLLMGKCVEMGVPAGPLLGELKAGRDVTLEDGTVIKAADVLSASEETPQVRHTVKK